MCLPVEDVSEGPEHGKHDGENRPRSHSAKHTLYVTLSNGFLLQGFTKRVSLG